MKDLLFRNSNKKVITRLSKRYLTANKGRNLIAASAIALTTLLFTSLFTIGGGLLKTQQDQTMRQSGGSAHGKFKYLTMEEYETLKEHPSIPAYGHSIFVSAAQNPGLSKLHAEIRYADENYARWSFVSPTDGTLPKGTRELATSDIVLDALGLPHEIGVTVPLEFTVNGTLYKEDFILSGFWKGDSMMGAQYILLSEEYVNSIVTVSDENYFKRADQSADCTLGMDIMFDNSFNVEAKLNKILTDCGYNPEEIATGVNWAYLGSGTPDLVTSALVLMALLLIGGAGYLIIYNVFYISVTRDIKNYGLLKTIGTAPKQLKRLVRRQALLLSLAGIPCGIFLGFLSGILLLPSVMKITSYSGGNVVISFSPWIPIFSALFALITVFISCFKPCRLAAGVSPIEALRAHEASSGRRKARQSSHISGLTMAWHNVVRGKKRVASVVISLTLSVVLLNSVYGATLCFDMDKYMARNILTDFSIGNDKLFSWFELAYLTGDTYDALSTLPGVSHASTVYMQEFSLPVSDKVIAVAEQFEAEATLPTQGDFIGYLKNVGQAAHIYGVDSFLYDKIEFYGEKPDWETFSSGNNVLTSSMSRENPDLTITNQGDLLKLEDRDGKPVDFMTLANGRMPDASDAKHGHLNDIDIILPLPLYLEYFNQDSMLYLHLEVEEGMTPSVEEAVSGYSSKNPVSYVSRATYLSEFKQLQVTYLAVGGVLAGILALVGLLNFLNSIATSIFTRRQEFAMLQSVGMTTKQLRTMLVWEGLWYIILTAAFTLTLGNLLSFALVKLIAGQMWFFTYHFTMLPMVLGLVFFIIPAFLIPRISYRSVSRLSIVERLRTQ